MMLMSELAQGVGCGEFLLDAERRLCSGSHAQWCAGFPLHDNFATETLGIGGGVSCRRMEQLPVSEEINLSQDNAEWVWLAEAEKHFIKHILAFSACLFGGMLQHVLPDDGVHEIIRSAEMVERRFTCEAFSGDFIGMNSELMTRYIEIVVDRFLAALAPRGR